jgi:signal transduction histidine kinase
MAPPEDPLPLPDLPMAVAALAAAPVSIVVFDGADRLRFVNAEMLRQLDIPADTVLIGRTQRELSRLLAFRGLLGPGDPELLAEQLLRVDRSRPHRRTSRRGDGRWFEFVSEPLPGGGFVSYAFDVTQHRRAEEEALERNRQMEMALHHQHTGIGIFDAAHRLLRHNPAYEEVLGLVPGTLRQGDTLEDVHRHLLDRHGDDPLILASIRDGGQIDRGRPHDEIRALPDGRAVRNISRPLPTGGFLVTVEDVTPLRQAEDEARHRAATLRGVLAALPYGISVYDAGHRLTMVNDAYQRILKGAELRVGDHLMDICRQRQAAGEYAPGVTAEEVFRRQFDFREVPRQRIRRDGTVLALRTAPLPDGGHINVVADVTALHQAEAQAQQRANLLRAMLDNMRHGICLFDSELRVVARNDLALALSGLRAEEMAPGAHLDTLRALQFARGEFGTGPAAEAAYRARTEVINLRKRERYTRTRADGTVVEINSDPTPDGGFVRTYTDVTEERRIRAEMEQARRVAEEASSAKTRFLATMSHELRTPLNAVIGFSEALLADERLPEEALEFSSAILEAGRHLLSLIDDILQVAQIGGGDLPVQTRPLFLPSVLESAVRLVRGVAEVAQVTLVLDPCPEDLPRTLGEERRLRQVLLNLLSNAVKFTPVDGEVRVSATTLPDGDVEVTVHDSGIGIDPEQLPRAFEPFVQLETTHDRRYGGSGLGLYLARAFARAMGGELTLDSARGQGTTARLRLLRAPAPISQEQTA